MWGTADHANINRHDTTTHQHHFEPPHDPPPPAPQHHRLIAIYICDMLITHVDSSFIRFMAKGRMGVGTTCLVKWLITHKPLRRKTKAQTTCAPMCHCPDKWKTTLEIGFVRIWSSLASSNKRAENLAHLVVVEHAGVVLIELLEQSVEDVSCNDGVQIEREHD